MTEPHKNATSGSEDRKETDSTSAEKDEEKFKPGPEAFGVDESLYVTTGSDYQSDDASFADELSKQDALQDIAAEQRQAQQQEYDNLESASNARINDLEEELGQTKDQLLRALADVENMRRRMIKERDDARKFSIASFARELLPVADNLKRALESTPDDLKNLDDRIGALLSGVEATEREMLRSFEKNGIKKIEPKGEIFNPNFHEVMFEAPIEGQPAGMIIELIEPGYILNERLLRPARVGVAKDMGNNSSGGVSQKTSAQQQAQQQTEPHQNQESSAEETSPPSHEEPGQNLDTEV